MYYYYYNGKRGLGTPTILDASITSTVWLNASATIGWTSSPSTSQVKWGTSPGVYPNTYPPTPNPTITSTHSVIIGDATTPIRDGQTIYYKVVSGVTESAEHSFVFTPQLVPAGPFALLARVNLSGLTNLHLTGAEADNFSSTAIAPYKKRVLFLDIDGIFTSKDSGTTYDQYIHCDVFYGIDSALLTAQGPNGADATNQNVAEITDLTITGDGSDFLLVNSGIFRITLGDLQEYDVWFNVDGLGTYGGSNPNIEVDISSTDSVNDIAGALASAIGGANMGGGVVRFTNPTAGDVPDASFVDALPMTIDIVQQGVTVPSNGQNGGNGKNIILVSRASRNTDLLNIIVSGGNGGAGANGGSDGNPGSNGSFTLYTMQHDGTEPVFSGAVGTLIEVHADMSETNHGTDWSQVFDNTLYPTPLHTPRIGPYAANSPVLVSSLSDQTVSGPALITTGTRTAPIQKKVLTFNANSAWVADVDTVVNLWLNPHKLAIAGPNAVLKANGNPGSGGDASNAGNPIGGSGGRGYNGGGGGASGITTSGAGGVGGDSGSVNGGAGEANDGGSIGPGGLSVGSVANGGYAFTDAAPEDGGLGGGHDGPAEGAAGGGGGSGARHINYCNWITATNGFTVEAKGGLGGEPGGNDSQSGSSGGKGSSHWATRRWLINVTVIFDTASGAGIQHVLGPEGNEFVSNSSALVSTPWNTWNH